MLPINLEFLVLIAIYNNIDVHLSNIKKIRSLIFNTS